jgi:hypothetical protein
MACPLVQKIDDHEHSFFHQCKDKLATSSKQTTNIFHPPTLNIMYHARMPHQFGEVYKNVIVSESIIFMSDPIVIGYDIIVPVMRIRAMGRSITPSLTYVQLSAIELIYDKVGMLQPNDVFNLYAQCSFDECNRLPYGDVVKSVTDNEIESKIKDIAASMCYGSSFYAIEYIKSIIANGLKLNGVMVHLDELIERESQYRRAIFCARLIQRKFREAIANPNMLLCKRRLMHEWGCMLEEIKPCHLFNA